MVRRPLKWPKTANPGRPAGSLRLPGL